MVRVFFCTTSTAWPFGTNELELVIRYSAEYMRYASCTKVVAGVDVLGHVLKSTVHFLDWGLGGRLAVGADWIFVITFPHCFPPAPPHSLLMIPSSQPHFSAVWGTTKLGLLAGDWKTGGGAGGWNFVACCW